MNRTTSKLAVLILAVTSTLAVASAVGVTSPLGVTSTLGVTSALGVPSAVGVTSPPGVATRPWTRDSRRSPGSPAFPASQDLRTLVVEHRYPIEGSGGDLSGPGLDFLLSEAREAEATVVGEMHGTREIPRLTRRLAEELRGNGYGAFVVETGPLSTPAMVDEVRSGIDVYRRRVVDYPFTVPFFEWRGEVAMLAAIVDAGYEIWGIDQEFVGSPRYWLDRLADLAPDDAARSLVAHWKSREMEAAAHYRRTGSTEKGFLMQASGADFAALEDAFSGNERALEILGELQESARIYQLYATGRNYASNHRRVEYMKENLARHLRHARDDGEPPRLLVKVGAMHGGRGYTPLNQLDVGNLVAAMVDLRGGESLHLFTVAPAVRQADGSVDDLSSRIEYLRPLLDRADDGPWTVFDLRPLRPFFHSGDHREAHPELADLAFRYDVVVLGGELHAARDLVN